MTWSVFFLVPTGRGLQSDQVSAEENEAVPNFLYDASRFIGIKTTEGHHYKRVVLQRMILEAHGLQPEKHLPLGASYQRLKEGLAEVTLPENASSKSQMRRPPMHVGSGSGFVFISHRGDVFPSGFLPLSGGNIRSRSLIDIYQSSPLFRELREPSRLKGRCGRCEFAPVCGGSRSRALATTGDVLAEEPACAYQPGSFPFPEAVEAMLAGHALP
jgi:AdoMet-dependent heme synthase